MKEKKYEIDMCTGPLLKKMLLFTVPLMFSSMLQLMFNAADVVVVGRFAGEHALAAVGSNGSLVSLMTNFFMGMSVGANVLVAHCFGAKQKGELGDTIQTAMTLSLISGAFLLVVGVVGARQLLIWMQVPEEVLELSILYLRIYFLGMPAVMVYNFGSSILRAVGDTRRPMVYLILAGIINVVLNLVFVIVFHMSVAGVALATIISQYVSATLVVRCLVKSESSVHLDPKKLQINANKLKGILRVGLPAGFQGVVFAISNVLIQSSINSFGAAAVAGGSAAANIEGFVYMAMAAFYQSAISFTSQNVGAGNYKRITRITVLSLMCVCATGLVMGGAAVVFGEPLLRLYTTNPEVIQIGVDRLKIVATPYAFCGMMDVMVGVIRGLGYSILPMVVSLLGACGLRVLWILTLFQLPRFHTVDWLYASYPISWLVTFLTHMICYLFIRYHLRVHKGISFKEERNGEKG